MPSTKNSAIILKSRSKKQPFKVRYIGKNGEILSTSELLTTRLNANKNIVAHLGLFIGVSVPVLDLTGKKPERYTIDRDGCRAPFDFE